MIGARGSRLIGARGYGSCVLVDRSCGDRCLPNWSCGSVHVTEMVWIRPRRREWCWWSSLVLLGFDRERMVLMEFSGASGFWSWERVLIVREWCWWVLWCFWVLTMREGFDRERMVLMEFSGASGFWSWEKEEERRGRKERGNGRYKWKRKKEEIKWVIGKRTRRWNNIKKRI